MKTPADIAAQLRKEWSRSALRCQRMRDPGAFPLRYAIGKPPPPIVTQRFDALRTHMQAWRDIKIGQVIWAQHRYREIADTIDYPAYWQFAHLTQWIDASDSPALREEYAHYRRILDASNPLFHDTLLRQRAHVQSHDSAEIIRLCHIADQLHPGFAAGMPLRCLTLAGNDSKFFARHQALLTQLLDCRFAGAVSEQGLSAFLGAADEREHWILLADLDGALLPFARMRVRSSDLHPNALPGKALLVVENERCAYQLPPLPDTIAVLGCGLDIQWLEIRAWQHRRLAYWGDIDTWGLTMLARARCAQPAIIPLLMNHETYIEHLAACVAEPELAPQPPTGLTNAEQQLFTLLSQADKGRLEQEFIALKNVEKALAHWQSA